MEDRRAEPRARRARKITPTSLHRAALHHLERFATTRAALARALQRRAAASRRAHGGDEVEHGRWIEELLDRLQAAGLLNDAAFARGRAETLSSRGGSTRAIEQKLVRKGVPGELARAALQDLRARAALDGTDLDLESARRYAQRRRIGPFRPDVEADAAARRASRQKDLAALARQGFSFDVARRVLDEEP